MSSKGAETTNGTASQHIHINKYVDLPDGSTTQIVDSGPLFTFLVIPKQQNGTRVLYDSTRLYFKAPRTHAQPPTPGCMCTEPGSLPQLFDDVGAHTRLAGGAAAM